jgi:hypothetical protein
MAAQEAESAALCGKPAKRGNAQLTMPLRTAHLTRLAPTPLRLAGVSVSRRALMEAVYLDPAARAVKMLGDIEDRVAFDLEDLDQAISLRAGGRNWFGRRFDRVLKALRLARAELQTASSDMRAARNALRRRSLISVRELILLGRRLECAKTSLQLAFDRLKDPDFAADHDETDCSFCGRHVKPLVHRALGGTMLNILRTENALSDACRSVS